MNYNRQQNSKSNIYHYNSENKNNLDYRNNKNNININYRDKFSKENQISGNIGLSSNIYDEDYQYTSNIDSINTFGKKNKQQYNRNFNINDDYIANSIEKSLFKSNQSINFSKKKDIEDEFEFNMPLEFESSKNTSLNMNNNHYNNFNIQNIFNENKAYKQDKFKSNEINNNNEKINYKLLNKIKKGEIDDEVEIINSHAKGNNVYLPIEEYCKLLN
jgi:hypothetical protein